MTQRNRLWIYVYISGLTRSVNIVNFILGSFLKNLWPSDFFENNQIKI
jgi:hypothetical protein